MTYNPLCWQPASLSIQREKLKWLCRAYSLWAWHWEFNFITCFYLLCDSSNIRLYSAVGKLMVLTGLHKASWLLGICALVRRKAGCKDTVGSGTWTGHYRPFSHAELPRSTTSMVANSLNQCFLLSKWSVDSTHVSPFISSSYHAGLDSDSSEMSVCSKHLIAFLICSFFLPFIYSRCDCRLSLAEIPLKHILYFLHSCF